MEDSQEAIFVNQQSIFLPFTRAWPFAIGSLICLFFGPWWLDRWYTGVSTVSLRGQKKFTCRGERKFDIIQRQPLFNHAGYSICKITTLYGNFSPSRAFWRGYPYPWKYSSNRKLTQVGPVCVSSCPTSVNPAVSPRPAWNKSR